MKIKPSALTYNFAFEVAAWLELLEVPTTRDHRLHSGHHHTSEKAYQCHSMVVDIDCHDDRSLDLQIRGGSFCDCKKHDKNNKIVWE